MRSGSHSLVLAALSMLIIWVLQLPARCFSRRLAKHTIAVALAPYADAELMDSSSYSGGGIHQFCLLESLAQRFV